MRGLALFLAAVAIATAASIEHIPTDSRVYDDIDLLKTAGLIRSMPYTSRPWTRAQAAQWVSEVESLVPFARLSTAERAALRRLERELADELIEPWANRRRPLASIPVPDVPGSRARLDGFARARACVDSQAAGFGIVMNNRPGDDFAFYNRLEVTVFNPGLVRDSVPRDSAGWHIPGKRVLPWQGRLTVENELAYLAFRLPWLRLEVGRDEFVWGPGYHSSVMLSDAAPALDHLQFSAAYRNFRFTGFTALLSRWGMRPRLLSAQRLEVSLLRRVTLGGAMMSVCSWDSFQPAQLGGLVNPLIPIYFSVANSGHDENLLVGFDAVAYLPPVKAYGQLFIDNYEFNDRRGAPNAVGLQAGLYAAPRLSADLRAEYVRVTAFTYYHRVHSTMYENCLVPLGHPLGPDADRALAVATYTPLDWLRGELAADYTRRGALNRGDFRNRTHDYGDTLPRSFPAVALDSLGNIVEEVEKTLRIAPGAEARVGKDLFVKASVALWRAENYRGTPGENKQGVDFDLKLQYRY